MPTLPVALLTPLTLGFVLALLGLAILVWRRRPAARGTPLFALLSLCMMVWTLGEAMPAHPVWRTIFFLAAAFAPAIAIHTALAISGRPFRLAGWLSYLFSLNIFVLMDVAPLSVAPLVGLLFYIAGVIVVAAELYPSLHAFGDRLARRRATYGLLLLALFLIGGMARFMTTPPIQMFAPAFAAAFFLVSCATFRRTRLFGVDVSPLEALFIVVISGGLAAATALGNLFFSSVLLASTLLMAFFGALGLAAMRAEERRRLAHSEAFAMATHGWLGTLSGMRAAADLLTQRSAGSLSESGAQLAEDLKRCSNRLCVMMETALHGSRLEARAFQPMPAAINLAAEIREVLADLEPLARVKSLGFLPSLEELPEQATIDANVLRTSLFNLIENAIKYTESGCVTVNVKAEGSTLTVTVADTGCGFVSHTAPTLFEKFRREENAARAGGAGLGLYVVKQLVGSVGGDVLAESDGPGKGATFTLILPMERS